MENKNKIVTVIMGQNCERFIEMCLESVKQSDAIIFLDGGSKDNTLKLIGDKAKCYYNHYEQNDKEMNGKQRNFYLNIVKDEYPDFWCLALDADEVVENMDNIIKFIQSAIPGVYSVNMRHFIGDLGHEDATTDKHWVLNRLFKISEADKYPEVEHPVLQPNRHKERPSDPFPGEGLIRYVEEDQTYYIQGFCDKTTVWHLSYTIFCFDILKKYDNHVKKSNMHTPEYLDNWKDAHILGMYPKKQVNILDIPDIILKNFKINKEKYYFQNRGLEIKHFIDVANYKKHFNL